MFGEFWSDFGCLDVKVITVWGPTVCVCILMSSCVHACKACRTRLYAWGVGLAYVAYCVVLPCWAHICICAHYVWGLVPVHPCTRDSLAKALCLCGMTCCATTWHMVACLVVWLLGMPVCKANSVGWAIYLAIWAKAEMVTLIEPQLEKRVQPWRTKSCQKKSLN